MFPHKSQKIYIGVAWPYVNDLFHIGNLAGAYLAPDIFARFHRLSGNEVLMVSGSDAHGTPIMIRAQKEGVSPDAIANRYHELNKKYLAHFHIDYDLYTSTATDNHTQIVQKMFLALLKHGFIKISTTRQPYSPLSKTFLQDRYIQGECPYCHYKEARGDQCESCGRTLEPTELINPCSQIDASPLILKETQNYFLDLSLLQDDIRSWIEKQDLRDWVKSEALGWTKEGLRQRAITRDLDYGVPLPVKKIPPDQRIQNIEYKVFYVWFEAVIGYLSAAIEYSKNIKKPYYWKKFFYEKDAKTFYFVGQDNLVFHTINWPAQLLGFDKDINLPTNVFVNKFLLLEGKKMSKSKGWFIDTAYLLEHYNPDMLRFYLALHMPQTKEMDFRWQDFMNTTNSVLIGTIGNFVHRVITFYNKFFGDSILFKNFKCDIQVKKEIDDTFEETREHLEKGNFKEALQVIINLASFGNQYLDKHQFWKTVTHDPQGTKDVLLSGILLIDNLITLLYPFIPSSMGRLASLLGKGESITSKVGTNKWRFSSPQALTLSSPIKPLFSKIEQEQIEKEKDNLHKASLNKILKQP